MEILAVMHPNDIAMAGRRISIRKVLLMTVGAFWCLLVLSSVRAAAARRLQIQGVVRSETGEPIADCLVMGNDLPTWVTTDKDGRYSMDVFESVPGFNQSLEVISFRAKGYMPWTKVVRRDSITLNATLATVRTTDRGLPSCPPSRPDKRQIDVGPIRIPLPEDVFVEKSGDGHLSETLISFSKTGRPYMGVSDGTHCCDGRPHDTLYMNAETYEEFPVVVGESWEDAVVDVRGIGKDGTLWRWMGPILMSAISYEVKSEEAARKFDKIIDSACLAY